MKKVYHIPYRTASIICMGSQEKMRDSIRQI